MNLKVKYNFQTPKSYHRMKRQFQHLVGNDMIILHKQSGQTYGSPVKTKIKQANNNFIVCEKSNGNVECFDYKDFYCGNLICHHIQ